MDLDQKQLLNQEDYLAKEKLKVINLNLIVSILSFLLMIALTVCSFLLDTLYSGSIPLFLGILGIIGILNAILMFIWSYWQKEKLVNTVEKWGESTDSVFSRTMLILSIFIFFGLISLTIILYLWSYRGLDIYLASYGSEDQSDYWDQYTVLAYMVSGCSAVNAIVLIYMIYATFVCCGSPNTVRILLYESGILQIFFGFMVLNYIKLVLFYDVNSKISSFLDLNLFAILALMIILMIILTIVVYIINYKRARSGYLMVGASLIIMLAIMIAIGGSIYRESLSIHNAFGNDCQTYLSILSADDIDDYGCSPKYVEYGKEYLNCSDNDQVLVWEEKINGFSNIYQNSIGCLNMNCCNIIGDVYEINLLRMESYNIVLVSMMFLSIAACFFLTNKYSGEKTLKKILEYLYMIATIIIITLGFVSLFLFQTQLPEEKSSVSVESSQFLKASAQVNYSLSLQFLPTSSCSLIKNYQPTYDISEFSLNSNYLGVRTIILSTNAMLWYYNNQSFIDIQIFDDSLASILFPTTDLSDKDILIFQGNSAKMLKFVNERVYLCPKSEVAPVYLQYFSASVNLTDNVANNSNISWVAGTNYGNYIEVTSMEKHENVQKHKKSAKNHKNLKNTTEYLKNVSNFTDLQDRLDAEMFGDLLIKTYSIDSEDILFNVSLKVYSGSQSSCTNNPNEAVVEVYSNETGQIMINNLQYGMYTVIGATSNTKSNCFEVTIFSAYEEKTLFLVNDLEINEIAVLLEWKSSLDLNLFGAFQLSAKEICIASYFNEECTGMSFKKISQINQTSAQMVKITVLGQYTYLFFLKRILSWNAYHQLNSNETNNDLLNSQFSLKGFVNEIQYPVNYISYTGTYSNASLVNAPNLAFLGFCVDGSKSDILASKNMFWTGNQTFPRASSVCT